MRRGGVLYIGATCGQICCFHEATDENQRIENFFILGLLKAELQKRDVRETHLLNMAFKRLSNCVLFPKSIISDYLEMFFSSSCSVLVSTIS